MHYIKGSHQWYDKDVKGQGWDKGQLITCAHTLTSIRATALKTSFF